MIKTGSLDNICRYFTRKEGGYWHFCGEYNISCSQAIEDLGAFAVCSDLDSELPVWDPVAKWRNACTVPGHAHKQTFDENMDKFTERVES